MGYLIPFLRAFALIVLPILIPIPITAFSQQSDLLRKICTNTSQTYTVDSTYANNVKVLLDDLFKKTPQNKYLFSNESLPGQGPKDPSIYGLALCRGDVSSDDCDFCLYDARCKITHRCNRTSAIVWYDYCQVKYSDVNFFGQIDHNVKDNIWYNVENVTDNEKDRFKTASLGLLGNLSKQASAKNNKHMFARGDIVFNQTAEVNIYGMAQCTLDLSPKTCNTCLDRAVKKLPIYNGGIYTVGARVFGDSCTVRYETYVFLDGNDKAGVSNIII